MKKGIKKELKTVKFILKITPSEKEMIQRLAKERGLTQSQVLRQYYLP